MALKLPRVLCQCDHAVVDSGASTAEKLGPLDQVESGTVRVVTEVADVAQDVELVSFIDSVLRENLQNW